MTLRLSTDSRSSLPVRPRSCPEASDMASVDSRGDLVECGSVDV